MSPAATTVEVSSFDVAVPFIVSALLVALGPFAALAVEHRLKAEYRVWAETAKQNIEKLDSSVHPDAYARSSGWTIDASQTLVACLGPLVGLLILRSHLGSALALLYVGSFVFATAAFLFFTFRVKVDGYAKKGIWIFTPLCIFGVTLNLVAAGGAALIGP